MDTIPQNVTSGKCWETLDVFNNIPSDLRVLPQWVLFRLGKLKKNGKRDKIPYNVHTGHKAKTNDLCTWGAFPQVVEAYVNDKLPTRNCIYG